MSAEGASETQSEGASSRTSQLEPGVEPGVWRYEMASKASVIVDAADYFAYMQEAMLHTRRRMLLIGWDFDTRIHLERGRRWWQRPWKRGYPRRLGSFIAWLARHRKKLDIRLLKWNFGIFTMPLRASMMWDLARWVRHPRINFKFDTAHPVGCSHHQKLAILDGKVAVCGGIDMTDKRWDTRDHRENDERRVTPRGKPYEPWHDATMMMEGDVANALEELGEDRWTRAGGGTLPQYEPSVASPWPEPLKAQFENVEIGIARTRAAYRDWEEVKEIEQLHLAHIKRAKHFIYAESQYFASRAIAEAIIERVQEDDPPEIVIVHPANADGWLEQQAMDHARAELVRAIEEADKKSRFSIWTPLTGETPIYVHAKIMIVDDEILRIGSANMNNRSMGLDSECDVFIDSTRKANAGTSSMIASLRHSLLAEHCGIEEDEVPQLQARYGSMAALIDHTLTPGEGRNLQRYHPPDLNDAEESLAQSALLDPEHPDDMFEPFAKGGLFRKGSRLARMRNKFRRKNGK
ncbi:phospholipase D-like domain-containing protein [Qipengyuania gelatinilytica]|uniref:Phospholipase D n=1 Tax=Qipengyuania gelatinilytica TaxID=2867231 RepID=A0ABX9A7A6_9SPHN|nr:phospholipase D-like domain-containing protein [Qipengyuania gelatinilytica]QZD95677.1 phospholipase [Qipengyuania gelatinilytica]